MVKRRDQGYFPAFMIAWVYTGLGEADEALKWLDTAYEERDSLLVTGKVIPTLDPLRSDPRFTALLKKIGLEP